MAPPPAPSGGGRGGRNGGFGTGLDGRDGLGRHGGRERIQRLRLDAAAQQVDEAVDALAVQLLVLARLRRTSPDLGQTIGALSQEAVDEVRGTYGRVDAAVVLYGPREVADRLLPGEDSWHHVGEPEIDAYLRDEIQAMVDVLAAEGLAVVWLTSPYVATDREHPEMLPGPHPESEPARMDRLNEIIREVAADEPAMRVVDLQGYLESLPGGSLDATFGADDEPMRPDGVHLTKDASAHVADAWLGDQVVEAARDAGQSVATAAP